MTTYKYCIIGLLSLFLNMSAFGSLPSETILEPQQKKAQVAAVAVQPKSLFDIDLIHGKGHNLETVNTYLAVRNKVNELLESGVDASDIHVWTDWDGVINGPGAWEQKLFSGEYVCPTTRRMLLEHEVDHRLRDEHVLGTHEYLRNLGVKITVITARPPIVDTELGELASLPNLMDVRHPEDQSKIHYDVIAASIHTVLSQMPDEDILIKAADKKRIMQNRSRVNLTGQPGLDENFVMEVDGHKIVYHDGFSFVGHDKGPALIALKQKLRLQAKHHVIIDDSPRALKSYIKVLDLIEGKVHMLHFPVPGQ